MSHMGTYESSSCKDSLGQVVARWSSTEDTVTSTGDLLGGKCPVLIAVGFYPQRPLKRNIATQAGHVKVKGSRNDLVSWGLHCGYNIYPHLWCISRAPQRVSNMASNKSLTLPKGFHTEQLIAHMILFWLSLSGWYTHQKAFQVEKPAPRRGRLTARPSGKFWIPIPMARFLQKQEGTRPS